EYSYIKNYKYSDLMNLYEIRNSNYLFYWLL
ncbi:hypothetical protein A5806_002509, partial [Enterococcus faecium]